MCLTGYSSEVAESRHRKIAVVAKGRDSFVSAAVALVEVLLWKRTISAR